MAFGELGKLREAMERFSTSFDPALITATTALRVIEDTAAIEKMAAAVRAKAAARLDDTDVSRRKGYRSTAEQVAEIAGTGVGAAIDAIATARRLEELPAADAAARRGELSPQQASAVAGAAAVNPEAEEELVEAAGRLPLKELQSRCADKRAEVEDREAQRERIRRGRYLRPFNDPDGAWRLSARDNPEIGAAIMAAIAAKQDELFNQARAEGRREPAEAYAMDALAALLGAAGASGTPPSGPYQPSAWAKAIIRIDFETLVRGHPLDGETCDIAGVPVAVSAVEQIIDSGSAFLAAVITKGEQVMGVAHFGRAPTARQQTALEWIYPTCAAEGCTQAARLQRDHRVDWAKTHTTVFDLLDLLCAFHHGLKTRENWGLVEGRGKRAFVPPDDPRHPNNQHAPPHAA
jgi:hypothetical protein